MNDLLYVIALQTGPQNQYGFMITMALIIVVFYFFMIKPQQKKQKEIKKFRETIKNGAKVLTIGGIYGKVVETSEKTVIIEVENKMRLKVDKVALTIDSSNLLVQK